MKATEFRIGNLVRSKTWHSVQPISGIIRRDDGDYSIMVNDFSHLLKKGYYIDIEPVLLTEEWLIKLGFEKDDYCYRKSIYQVHYNYKQFEFRYQGHLLATFQYVHQLQNLYFALTQKELSLKDENTL